MSMTEFKAAVCTNEQLTFKFYRLEFEWDTSASLPQPGQFITVRNTESTDPLLRRPFAIAFYALTSHIAGIIYERRGKATHALSQRAPGDIIDILGPLGTPFTMLEAHTHPVLVAGGIGIGPMMYLSRTLAERGTDHHLVIGGRTGDDLFDIKARQHVNLAMCTDDGTLGLQGTAATVAGRILAGLSETAVLYACGPYGMLKACHHLALERDIPCWVAMEQVIGCGVGACMGCAIEVVGPERYARVCTEGPVFNSRVIKWR